MEQKRAKRNNKKKRFFSTLMACISIVAIIGVGILVVSHFLIPSNKPVKKNQNTEETFKKNKEPSNTPVQGKNEITQKNETAEKDDSQSGIQIVLADELLKASANQVYYGVYYFNSGDYCSSNNSTKTSSASIIKVFIMEYAYAKDASKELNLDETVNGVPITELIKKMIQVSDNEATNTLITYFGMEQLNNYFIEQGYKDTVIERKMLDIEAMNSGLDNYTSLDDTMLFLKKIYKNRDSASNLAMLEIMKNQTIRTKIPSLLPSEISIANKTGELDRVENDIGIVFADQDPFAIVILTKDTYDVANVRTAIGNFALEAYQIAIKKTISQ